MSNVQVLRELVKQRLNAAAEEIFGLFERTIAEYEEELSRSKEENERQRKLLDAVIKPHVRLHRTDAQLLLLSVVTEEGPTEHQEGNPSQEPEVSHIKEEQEGEQLQGLEEAGIKLTFTPDPAKSDGDDEEKAQSSQLHKKIQTEENREAEEFKTENDGEDCGGPVPAGKANPDSPLQQPATHDKTLHSSESETDDSRDWEETKRRQSHSNPLQNSEVPISDVGCHTGKTSLSFSKCTGSSGREGHLQKHTRKQTGVKTFSCAMGDETFPLKKSSTSHKTLSSERKLTSCSVCHKTFKRREVVKHKKIHATTSTKRQNLTKRLDAHAGKKHYTCSVCKTSFSSMSKLAQHMKLHPGEKLFSCLICGKKYAQKKNLQRHSFVHTGEKPFSCSVCERSFVRLEYVRYHKCAGKSQHK